MSETDKRAIGWDIRYELIVSRPFLISLLLLLVNDLYFKETFGNWITGKLSDFSGIFMVTLLLLALLPWRRAVIWLVMILFVFWKSPLSTPLIEWLRVSDIVNWDRVMDYTDLLALAMVPLALWYADRKHGMRLTWRYRRLLALPPIVGALIAIMGTSMVTYQQEFLVRKSVESRPITQAEVDRVVSSIAARHALYCYQCELDRPPVRFAGEGGYDLAYSFDRQHQIVSFTLSGHHCESVQRLRDEIASALGEQFKGLEMVFPLKAGENIPRCFD